MTIPDFFFGDNKAYFWVLYCKYSPQPTISTRYPDNLKSKIRYTRQQISSVRLRFISTFKERLYFIEMMITIRSLLSSISYINESLLWP
jgi:hypothetical protein